MENYAIEQLIFRIVIWSAMVTFIVGVIILLREHYKLKKEEKR
jgi:hypothetical protein